MRETGQSVQRSFVGVSLLNNPLAFVLYRVFAASHDDFVHLWSNKYLLNDSLFNAVLFTFNECHHRKQEESISQLIKMKKKMLILTLLDT